MLLTAPVLLRGPLKVSSPVQQKIQSATAPDLDFAKGERLRSAGQWDASGHAFAESEIAARARGDLRAQARAELSEGGCQFREFNYRGALATYLKVRRLAQQLGDRTLAGSVSVNLASLYSKLGDLPAAKREVDGAVHELAGSARTDYLAMALIQSADVEAELGNTSEAAAAYQRAIALAAHQGNSAAEALGWDELGASLLEEGHLDGARRALTQAYRLRSLHHDDALPVTRARLAELELKEGHPALALVHLDAVLANPGKVLATSPRYQILYRRAQMLSALGRDDEALAEYRATLQLAALWREDALPSEAVRASTVAFLDSVYAGASDAAARLAFVRHDNVLAGEALEMLAENRSADLREQRSISFLRENRLPARYYALLAEIRALRANAAVSGKGEDMAKAGQIRGELDTLLNELGLEPSGPVGKLENFRSQKTLITIEQHLTNDEALLSFEIGTERSWLWAVTRSRLRLFSLPGRAAINRAAAAASSSVDESGAVGAGREFSTLLFGQLPASIWSKRDWLLVGAGGAFQKSAVAALAAVGPRPAMSASLGTPLAPLVAQHNLRFLADEMDLATALPPPASPTFVGIGDPIYNLADARLQALPFRRASWGEVGGPDSPFGRLPGSGREVRLMAAAFEQSNILTGASATLAQVQEALAHEPFVIHFAVHVIAQQSRPDEAALALSLGNDGLPELLTPELIATLHVPGSLVILNGCDSQQAKAVPGLGMLGLSRAWLLAGASAVIVDSWPVPDDSGAFFAAFYRHFLASGVAPGSVPERAAAALADAQREMQAGAGYRRSPEFWAAYRVVSKE